MQLLMRPLQRIEIQPSLTAGYGRSLRRQPIEHRARERIHR
jgi:hypothetical protein